jgi:hypothetical protein
MRTPLWIVRHLALLSLLIGMNSAQAQIRYDCVVKGPANSTLPVYGGTEVDKAMVVARVPPGSLFYTTNRIPYEVQPGVFAVHKFDGNGDFAEIGYMKAKHLDCDGSGATAEYPFIIRNGRELSRAFGLVGDHEQERKVRHEKNRCFWKGEADLDLSVSDEFFSPYREKGFSLKTLCLSLKAGDQIRFDPETGARMPTYARLKVPFNEEYLLIAPSCLARGEFVESKPDDVAFAKLSPIGCRVNFHPWSGRRLSDAIAETFTKLFELFVGGEAGGVNEDSKVLAAQAPSRILTLAKINALRDQMKMK